jgi:tetratricopeptide (TPR) repeat protein
VRERSKALRIAVLFPLLLTGCGDFTAGVDAYREGRYRDAHAAFRSAEEEGASAELSFNRALAALRAGDLSDAESSAQRAADRAPELAPLCGFLQGNAAFERCRVAERQADSVAAEPFAFDVAIAYARKAVRLWQQAAMRRPDWPEARRNVERALRKLEELRQKKEEADPRQRRTADPKPRPDPIPQPPLPGQETEIDQDPEVSPQLTELSAEQIARLLDKLAEKEKDKAALRRSTRRQDPKVERDW